MRSPRMKSPFHEHQRCAVRRARRGACVDVPAEHVDDDVLPMSLYSQRKFPELCVEMFKLYNARADVTRHPGKSTETLKLCAMKGNLILH